jgi:hypothetical protein
MVKLLLALMVGVLLGVGAGACGSNGAVNHAISSRTLSSSGTTRPSASTTSNPAESEEYADVNSKVDGDRDEDVGAPNDDTNNDSIFKFSGKEASAAERLIITALIKRYYALALAGDGAKACSIIYSSLAESLPEDYGQSSGPSFMRGAKTCAATLTLLFKHYHDQLAIEIPKLAVGRIRIHERHGTVLLTFGSLRGQYTSVMREGKIWKIAVLLGASLP